MSTKDRFENDGLSVYGIYHNEADVELAVDAFRDRGFRAKDISVLVPTGDHTKEFSHSNTTKSPEGATIGGAGGALLGGGLGWLVGVGSLTIPGFGPFLAAGPILAALSGVGVGGALGGITGGLIGLGLPEYEATRYEGRIKEGGILMSVHCDNSDWEEKAKNIFKKTNAEDISCSSEASADNRADPRSKGDRISY